MAASDYTDMTGANFLDSSHVLRGPTTGFPTPTGGASFTYALNSKDTSQGIAAVFATPMGGQTNFAPMLKGGSVRCAFKRGASVGNVNFAPFMYIGFQSNDVAANGYVLGLGDANDSHLILKKVSGTPSSLVTAGLPDSAPGGTAQAGILMRSTRSFANNIWVHVRLDAVYNTNGDVILKVYQNGTRADAVDPSNPAGSPVSIMTPSWQLVPGMENFIDDVTGVNAAQGGPANPPFVGGYTGYGLWTRDVGRRAMFCGIEVLKQL